jgi:hypothetical protein
MSNANLALLIALLIRRPITRRVRSLDRYLFWNTWPVLVFPVVACFNYFLALSPELCSLVLRAFYLCCL